MDGKKWQFPVFLFELIIVYGALWYLQDRALISEKIFFLSGTFTGLVFALYYGIQGAAFSVVSFGLILLVLIPDNLLVFLSTHVWETVFFLGTLLVIGLVKSLLERKVISADIANQILNQRVERLTVELSERDRALQDAFQEVLVDMESPKIMYQALRRMESIRDKESFFNEILYILYTHCHAEKSGIYEPTKGGGFKRTASFGSTELPAQMTWGSEEIPEILRVVKAEKEVIIPKEMYHRMVMTIPILSPTERLAHVILIEEIRFINFSDNVINLLKVAAFWIKSMMEDRLFLEERLGLSVYSSVVVYNPEVSRRRVRDTISRCKKYRLPLSFLRVNEKVEEETAIRLSTALRLYDELYMTGDDGLLISLPMTAKENIVYVLDRLKKTFPELAIEESQGDLTQYG